MTLPLRILKRKIPHLLACLPLLAHAAQGPKDARFVTEFGMTILRGPKEFLKTQDPSLLLACLPLLAYAAQGPQGRTLRHGVRDDDFQGSKECPGAHASLRSSG